MSLQVSLQSGFALLWKRREPRNIFSFPSSFRTSVFSFSLHLFPSNTIEGNARGSKVLLLFPQAFLGVKQVGRHLLKTFVLPPFSPFRKTTWRGRQASFSYAALGLGSDSPLAAFDFPAFQLLIKNDLYFLIRAHTRKVGTTPTSPPPPPTALLVFSSFSFDLRGMGSSIFL